MDLKQSSATASQGYSHLRISNDDALCNNEDLIDDDDSYFDDYSHFKDESSQSQSVLIHQQAIEDLCRMSQEVARGTIKQMHHHKICRGNSNLEGNYEVLFKTQ
jgi:hypothetical protein